MNRHRVVLKVFCVVLITATLFVRAQAEEKTSNNDPALKRWLEKYPASDSDGDGVLTESEARTFRNKKKNKGGKASKVEDIKSSAKAIPLSHSDISYGPDERNKLDLWLVESKRPTPVLIYFHGGSFKAGNKSSVLKSPVFESCLKGGVSVISANYRYSTTAPFPAPMLDGARVVQFVRSKALEWNIDPGRIALSGGSAGATMALWIALHDEMADPNSDGPVLRYSTRVSCVVGYGGPASMEPEYISEHAGSKNIGGGIAQLFGVKTSKELASPNIRKLLHEASPINHVTKDDPPLWLTYKGKMQDAPFPEDARQNIWIHHICMGMPLKKMYDGLHLRCQIHDQENPATSGSEIEFLREILMKGNSKGQ